MVEVFLEQRAYGRWGQVSSGVKNNASEKDEVQPVGSKSLPITVPERREDGPLCPT